MQSDQAVPKVISRPNHHVSWTILFTNTPGSVPLIPAGFRYHQLIFFPLSKEERRARARGEAESESIHNQYDVNTM